MLRDLVIPIRTGDPVTDLLFARETGDHHTTGLSNTREFIFLWDNDRRKTLVTCQQD
jgi:hypothetical protein